MGPKWETHGANQNQGPRLLVVELVVGVAFLKKKIVYNKVVELAWATGRPNLNFNFIGLYPSYKIFQKPQGKIQNKNFGRSSQWYNKESRSVYKQMLQESLFPAKSNN